MPDTLTTPAHSAERAHQEQYEALSEAGKEVFRKMDAIVTDRLTEAAWLMKEAGDQGTNRDIFQLARANQERFLREDLTPDELEKKGIRLSDVTAERLALLMLDMPFAAEARASITHTPEGTPKNTEAIAVLSQFNHDIVQAVEYMPKERSLSNIDKSLRARFPEELWLKANALCTEQGLPIMPRHDFTGTIVPGVAREAAFVDALNQDASKQPGNWEAGTWLAVPATVEQDMRGIDVQATDGEVVLDIDVKGGGKFQHILNQLRENPARRTQLQVTAADLHFASQHGFLEVTYSKAYNPQRVWIVDADRLGTVAQFEYTDTAQVRELVETLGAIERTERDLLRKIGKHAINT